MTAIALTVAIVESIQLLMGFKMYLPAGTRIEMLNLIKSCPENLTRHKTLRIVTYGH